MKSASRPPGQLRPGRGRLLTRGGQGQVGHVDDHAGAEDGQAEDEVFQLRTFPGQGRLSRP